MTDPTLTEQLEQEAAETVSVLQADPPVETTQETPAAQVKYYYKANRHDRRKAKALARKKRSPSK